MIDVAALECLGGLGPPLPAVVDIEVNGWNQHFCVVCRRICYGARIHPQSVDGRCLVVPKSQSVQSISASGQDAD